jgi:hypothetical protein
MIYKFCIRNSDDRCIQCRDYAPQKRVCPVYRITKKERTASVETAKSDFRAFLEAERKKQQ